MARHARCEVALLLRFSLSTVYTFNNCLFYFTHVDIVVFIFPYWSFIFECSMFYN